MSPEEKDAEIAKLVEEIAIYWPKSIAGEQKSINSAKQALGFLDEIQRRIDQQKLLESKLVR